MSKMDDAIDLLRDRNLVWDDDFNRIRFELVELLHQIKVAAHPAGGAFHGLDFHALSLAHKLVPDTEHEHADDEDGIDGCYC